MHKITKITLYCVVLENIPFHIEGAGNSEQGERGKYEFPEGWDGSFQSPNIPPSGGGGGGGVIF